MKKLLIDVNSIVPYYLNGKTTGIGRTTLELVQALGAIPQLPFEITLYSQNMKGIGGKNTGLHFPKKHLYLRNRESWNKVISQLPIREWFTGYDMMHIPHNFEHVHCPERCILTIHDAMFFSYPEQFLGHDKARKQYPKLAQKAKAIITCSENSRKEIIQYMNIPQEKVFVSYWGVNHRLFKPQESMGNKFTGEKPFFLSVSCNIGRKNTISVLKAYELFYQQEPEHELILVWNNPPTEIKERYSAPFYQNKIHFVGGVSDVELSRLYASSTASFFPSKYEGFGLPVLESMACGTPVITCKNSSLSEVGGDAAIYVEPEDCHSMCKWMEAFENNTINKSEWKQKCITQASIFTWNNCAKQTIEVYKQCLDL